MFKKILSLAGFWGNKALQAAGTAALYGGAATCFAAILLGIYLSYAWNIDKTKYYKILATAQDLDVEAQRKEAEKVAEIGYQKVLERRAERNRQAEFAQASALPEIVAEPIPEPPKPVPPPAVDDQAKISAFEKYIQDYRAKSQADGITEETRLLENMDAEQAKEVIRKLWQDGANRRVLEMLLAMDEKKRGGILYAMRQDETEELKSLCEILQRIGDGEPVSGVIDEAVKKSNAATP